MGHVCNLVKQYENKCIAQKRQLREHIGWCIHSKMIDLVESSDFVPHLQSIQNIFIQPLKKLNECFVRLFVIKQKMKICFEKKVYSKIKYLHYTIPIYKSQIMNETLEAINEVRDSIKRHNELLSFHIYQYYQVTDIDQKCVHEQNIYLQEQNIKRANQEIEDLILSFFLIG